MSDLESCRPARWVRTEDGYTFKEQPDGSWTDGDMTFSSLNEFGTTGIGFQVFTEEPGKADPTCPIPGAEVKRRRLEEITIVCPMEHREAAIQWMYDQGCDMSGRSGPLRVGEVRYDITKFHMVSNREVD